MNETSKKSIHPTLAEAKKKKLEMKPTDGNDRTPCVQARVRGRHDSRGTATWEAEAVGSGQRSV
jgi:hypothetical protein